MGLLTGRAYVVATQRKAENFYTNANVKNKNRTKAALMKSLVGKRGADGARKKRR